MKRKSPYPIAKVTLNLREGDADFLAQHYPDLGYGLVIRQLVAAAVDKIKTDLNAKGAQLSEVNQ